MSTFKDMQKKKKKERNCTDHVVFNIFILYFLPFTFEKAWPLTIHTSDKVCKETNSIPHCQYDLWPASISNNPETFSAGLFADMITVYLIV